MEPIVRAVEYVYCTFQSIPHGHYETPVLEQVFDEPFVDMFTDTSEFVFKGFVIQSHFFYIILYNRYSSVCGDECILPFY